MSNSQSLEGTRAVVTGATGGLGRAMAAALVRGGAQVVVTSRSRERAEEAARELGAGAVGIASDVRDQESVARLVGAVHEQFGGIDLLVNNAGIGMRTVNPRFLEQSLPFWEVPPDGFRDVIETKLTGVFLVARAFAPVMLAAGSGRIVNISMSTSTMTRVGFVPYGPAGAGIEALSRIMAAELAETPVRVNMLLPGGATATGMVPADAPSEVRARLLDPSIMGPPIAWLASEAAEDVHDERIIASEFPEWLAARSSSTL
ncbi:SDR family oxidoreductase [Nocardia sp. NPDC006630]|uniref:SDR family NAD(P)-dependent oxidoreductase n=1 Tax=Nocardia sp. NPDC006630 TaxID=3157181 RepID=UPI0033ABF06F